MPSSLLAERLAARRGGIENPKKSLSDRLKEREARKQISAPAITGNIETDDSAEVAHIKARLKADKEAMHNAYDMAFYVPIVFVNKAQADAFLKAMRLDLAMDEHGAYIDGVRAAKLHNVELPTTTLKSKANKPDARLLAEVAILD